MNLLWAIPNGQQVDVEPLLLLFEMRDGTENQEKVKRDVGHILAVNIR